MKFSDRPNCLFRAHVDIYFILSFTCQCCQISYLTQRKNIKLYFDTEEYFDPPKRPRNLSFGPRDVATHMHILKMAA